MPNLFQPIEFSLSKFDRLEKTRHFYPAEGRTFLRTVGAQRASVRPSVHQKKAVFKWLQIEKYNEIERVCVPWARIYKYIDSENVFWLQKRFGILCFGSTILLSEKDSSEYSLNPCEFFSDWVSFSLVIMFSKDKFDACLHTLGAQQFIVILFVQNGV